LKKRTNQQNAQINFGLINLLLFNHDDGSIKWPKHVGVIEQ